MAQLPTITVSSTQAERSADAVAARPMLETKWDGIAPPKPVEEELPVVRR